MNIEWFNPKIGSPKVTLASYGLNLNAAAFTYLDNPKEIAVGCSDNKIIIMPVKEKGLRVREANGVYRITNRDLIRFIGIQLKIDLKISAKSIKKPLIWDKDNECLIADFKLGVKRYGK